VWRLRCCRRRGWWRGLGRRWKETRGRGTLKHATKRGWMFGEIWTEVDVESSKDYQPVYKN
jgi:hypothetical protein